MIASSSSAMVVSIVVPRDRSNDDGVFVRCAFPYKAIVNFLISRVIVSMSLHEMFFFVEGSILAQDERWRRA